ncbi:hypothetical protein BU23DRAFT_484584 [Bimuria novae-zelandiae CBS 107.79]|uniref:Uncharacterized protein n=1 Tax=Bimuria novae-zelandiae CBS 107.79 TaxID=1447943 RepID=A0A6A5UT00_9PLEO|nr:hypothetical protein BU23DRAFT_484584 [Bimuria novae-zelandiae CBS 107.79]
MNVDCPRQPVPRPMKELSYEVTNHVNAYLDHHRYEQAFVFLQSLLAAGTSISVPSKPHAGLLAPVAQLALASTLVVYPPITTKATSADALKGSDAAVRYLRCVHDTVDLPVYKTIRAAFTFSDTRWRGPALLGQPSSPSSAFTHRAEQLHVVAANSKSLWSCAEDFWHVVGWAFNCSVIHKKRWARWKLWLELMLDFLEADWDSCIKKNNPLPERVAKLQESLIWRYITSREPLAGNTRKRMFAAILATGDSRSCKDFPEVWLEETAEAKQRDTHRKDTGPIDIDAGDMDDYGGDEEDVEMQDAPQPAVKRETSRRTNTSQTSEYFLPPLEDTFIPDYEAAVARLGGIDAVDLRQRFIALLAKVTKELRQQFTSLSGLCDTLASQLRYFPVHVLHVLVTTSRLLPAEQVALNVTILTAALTFDHFIDCTARSPTQTEFIEYLLPLRASEDRFTANAKVSLLLEQVFMYMMNNKRKGKKELKFTNPLRVAVETGIEHRNSVKGRKDSPEEKEQGKALLDTSSQRLSGLLYLLKIIKAKVPERESPRKKR